MTKAATSKEKDGVLYFGSSAETLLKVWIDHPPFISQDDTNDLVQIGQNLRTVLDASIQGIPDTDEMWEDLKNDKIGSFAPLAGYKTNKEFTKRAKSVLIKKENKEIKFHPTRRRGERFSFISDWSFSIPEDADDETLAKSLLEALDRCET